MPVCPTRPCMSRLDACPLIALGKNYRILQGSSCPDTKLCCLKTVHTIAPDMQILWIQMLQSHIDSFSRITRLDALVDAICEFAERHPPPALVIEERQLSPVGIRSEAIERLDRWDHVILPASQTRPLSVRRYFCWELLGFSGMVISNKPSRNKGLRTWFLNLVRSVLPAIFISSVIPLSIRHLRNISTWGRLGADSVLTLSL